MNSDILADMFLNLPGQVTGTADVLCKINSSNKFDNINGNVSFNVKNGFLPKLGSVGFMIKNSKKIKISDLVNVDLTQKDALQSDIKGIFQFYNSQIKNLSLTTQQQYLSTLIEGSYNISEQNADLNLFGKYNTDAPKGVKVVFIPLNLILKAIFRPEETMNIYESKINKIPAIDADAEHSQIFRVKLNGNLNKDNLKVEIKSIR